MDDRHAEYVIALGGLCAAGERARLRIEVVTTRGQTVVGLPGSSRTVLGDGELGETGVPRALWVDDTLVNLDEIVRCTIYPPEVASRQL